MFNGYYLKINGVIYPTANMVIPTYAPINEPIVVDDYYDAGYNRHIEKAVKENISIEFSIRKLNNSEYPDAIAPFVDTMIIEYYEPKTDSYLTDTFTYVNSLTPSVLRQYGNKIWYNELPMKLVRKVD